MCCFDLARVNGLQGRTDNLSHKARLVQSQSDHRIDETGNIGNRQIRSELLVDCLNIMGIPKNATYSCTMTGVPRSSEIRRFVICVSTLIFSF